MLLNTKGLIKKLNRKSCLGIFVVIVLAVFGVHSLLSSHAQSSGVSINADSGSVVAPATTQNCVGSDDGMCVQFGKPPLSFSIPSSPGNEILESNDTNFIPYGFVVPCAGYTYSFASPFKVPVNALCNNQAPNDPSGNTGLDVINAASKDWNANVVRLQLSQEDLFDDDVSSVCSNPMAQTPSGNMNLDANGSAYLKMVDGLITAANSNHMVAIITLQEELAGGLAFPTCSSLAFWEYMSNHYKTNPEVFFDLFNEPSLNSSALDPSNSNTIWGIWQNGGEAFQEGVDAKVTSSIPTYYVGMQALVTAIRANGANNIIVAQGPNHDKDLSGLPGAALSGGSIAYGFEPNLHGDNTNSQQFSKYGQYAKNFKIMPEAFLDMYGNEACDADPADYFGGTEYNGNSVTGLFPYLKSLDMGLISFALYPGIDIMGTNLNAPTSYSNSDGAQYYIEPTLCNTNSGTINGPTAPAGTIGPGSILQQYYKANSKQLNN